MRSHVEQAARGFALAAQLGSLALIAVLATDLAPVSLASTALVGLLAIRGMAGLGHGWVWRKANPERGRRLR